MRADLWGWISRYNAEAALQGNIRKQQLSQVYWSGWDCLRQERPDEALDFFNKGVDIAKDLQEPCWELFFDYWITEVFLFYKIDYNTGLDRAIKVASRAHKTEYQECPVRGRVYFTMLQAYYSIDTIGYEAEIRKMLADMDETVPLDDDTSQRMQYIRAGLAFNLEDYASAESEIQLYLNMCIHNSFRMAGGYSMLRAIAYIRGNLQDAFNYAHHQAQHAQMAELQSLHTYATLWQAVYAQRLGQTDRAEGFMGRGLQLHEKYDFVKRSQYYDSLAEYYELRGELNRALRLREEQVATMQTVGSPDSDSYARLQYCRFLGRTGRDIQAALQACYTIAQELRKPDLYLAKLKELEQGNYYEYSWQRN